MIVLHNKQMVMCLVAALCSLSSPASAIIDGAPVTSGEFASTVILTTSAGSCSATLVGPQVLITAASCVADGVEMRVGLNKIRCNRHPDYHPKVAADVALCLLDTELAGIPSERIASGTGSSSKIDKILLVGYGCTKRDGVDRQIGQLSAGEARVTRTSAADRNFLVATGASLCFGDAGGGAYLSSSGKHQLIGVNSSGNLNGKSLIWPLANTEFVSWANSWAAQHNAKICGLDESACRAGGGLSIEPEALAKVIAQLTQMIGMIGRPPQATIATADSPPANPNDLQRVTKVSVRKDNTVRELANLVCGSPQSDDYFEQFEQYHVRAGTLFTRETKFDHDIVVDFPACGVSSRVFETVVTAENDFPWKYYLPILNRKLTPLWKDFRRPGGSINKDENSEYFLDVLSALNPDINVFSPPPNIKIKVPLVPRKAAARQLDAMLPPTVQPIFSLQVAKDECTAPPELASYPFDAMRVLDIMRLNKDARGHPRGPVSILIADSGLFGAGRGMFPEIVLQKNGDFDSFAQSIDPTALLEGGDASHGTEVASVALGGPVLGRMNAISPSPRIQLVVKPIYRKFAQGGATWIGTEENLFDELYKTAMKYGSYIVNLSIKTQGEIPSLATQLSDRSPYMFIVAAGNAEGGATPHLGQDGTNPIFPAMYGGEGIGLYNLVTVAALHWDSQKKTLGLAPFTHSASNWIELAAPGCKIPVVSYDNSNRAWLSERRSGTSFAAPLVTFTAALIKSERGGGGSPVDLKRRLLISADLDPSLKSEIQDGRMLNIAKAVAVENDVLEIANSKRLVVGAVSFFLDGQPKTEDNSIQLKCSSALTTIKISDILKIRPRFGVEGAIPTAKVYLKPLSSGTTRLFRNFDCELPETLTVVMRDDERDAEESFGMSEIVDLVRKD
jgi:hypothetical protein